MKGRNTSFTITEIQYGKTMKVFTTILNQKEENEEKIEFIVGQEGKALEPFLDSTIDRELGLKYSKVRIELPHPLFEVKYLYFNLFNILKLDWINFS